MKKVFTILTVALFATVFAFAGNGDISKKVDNLTTRLGLSVEQQAKTKEIMTAAAAELEANNVTDRDEYKAVRSKYVSQFVSILTAEQKAKFESRGKN